MRNLLIFTAISAGVITAGAQVNSPLADGYTSRGVFMELNANCVGAIDQLSYVEDLDPSASEARRARYYKAMAAAERQDDNAITLLKAYLNEYPAGGERHVVALAIADCLYTQGHYAEALRDYRNLAPASFDGAREASYRFHQGFCLLKLADYDEADRQFAALRGSKTYGNAARFYQGYVAYAKGDYKAAADLLKGVDTSKAPGEMADFYLAQIYFNDQDYEKALSTARKLLKNPALATDDNARFLAEARRVAGESLYELGNDAEALKYIEQYIGEVEQPMPSALYILGVSQYREGKYPEAIATLTPVTDEASGIGQSAYLFIGQSYLKEGDTDAAIIAFDKAAQMNYDPEVAETAYYNYAVASTRGGRVPFGSSAATFEDFLRRYPKSPYAHKVQAYVVNGYLHDNDYNGALKAIESISNPSQATLKAKQHVLYTLGTRDFESGNIPRALARLLSAREMADLDPEIANECNLWIGQCYYDQGKYPQAADAFLGYISQAKGKGANLAMAYYDLGYTRFAQKRYGDALTDFNRFLSAPGDANRAQMADAYNRAADCQYYTGDFTHASQNYSNAYNAYPEIGDYPLFQQAMMAGFKRDYPSKINGLNDLMKKFPRSGIIPSALLELADAQSSHGDRRAAISTYHQLVDRYPTTEQGRQGYLMLGISYYAQGDTDRALKAYKTLIQRFPTSSQARVAVDDLKRIYAERGGLESFQSFLAGIKGAPQLYPEEMETLSFQAGEKEFVTSGNAVKLEQYLQKYPSGVNAPTAVEYLLTAAEREGDNAKALEYATIITRDYPDSHAVESALLTKANIEYRQGKGEVALNTYRQLEKRASTPENLDAARIGMLRVNRDLGRDDEVIKIADLLLSTSTNSSNKDDITFARGFSHMRKGDNAKAIADWQPLSRDPKTEIGAKSSYYLAQLHFDANEIDKADKTVQHLIDSGSPHNYWLARGYILLSDIKRAGGKTFEADEYLKVLRDNYPGSEPDIQQMIDSRLNK